MHNLQCCDWPAATCSLHRIPAVRLKIYIDLIQDPRNSAIFLPVCLKSHKPYAPRRYYPS